MPVYNDSVLDLEVTMKLGITGLTLRSLGETEEEKQDEQLYRLLGPIPVPDLPEYVAIGMSFVIDPNIDKSTYYDSFALWMIIDSDFKDKIYQNYDKIQNFLEDFVRTFAIEEEMDNGIKINAFKVNFKQHVDFQ